MNVSPPFTSLVTGGAGFIGAHVGHHLIALGHTVIVLDDLSGGFRENVPKQAIFIEGSITDEQLVQQLFKHYTFTYVYHLAAYAAEGLSPFIRKFNYENNLIGSINLINAAVNYKVHCFIFTSSIAVYGSLPTPYTEQQYPQPEDPYGIAKLAVEQDLKNAKEQFGLNYIIFRPHNVYGSKQHIGDPYRNVIGIFMNQVMQGKPLHIFGEGSQRRAFTHIDDVAPYISKSYAFAKAYNQTFNIGATITYSINELAMAVMTAMQRNVPVTYQDARLEVHTAQADHQHFNRVFNPAPPVDLEEGLQRMAKWVQFASDKKKAPFTAIEITKNLPPFWKKIIEE